MKDSAVYAQVESAILKIQRKQMDHFEKERNAIITNPPPRPPPMSEWCTPAYNWTRNALGDNPCQVARGISQLLDTEEDYPIFPLLWQDEGDWSSYPSPSKDQVSTALCNSEYLALFRPLSATLTLPPSPSRVTAPAYNVISMCAACQFPGEAPPLPPPASHSLFCIQTYLGSPRLLLPVAQPIPRKLWSSSRPILSQHHRAWSPYSHLGVDVL